MDPNEREITFLDDLEEEEKDGFTGIIANGGIVKLKEKLQKLENELLAMKDGKNGNEKRYSDQLGASMLQMVWQYGEKFGRMELKMEGMGKQIEEMEKKMGELGVENGKLKEESSKLMEQDGKLRKIIDELKGDIAEKDQALIGFNAIMKESQKWAEHCPQQKLAISGSGLVLTHSGPDGMNSVRAYLPIPAFNLKAKSPYIVDYFEVLVKETNYSIRIGFCDNKLPMEGNSLGNEKNSIGLWQKGGMDIEGSFTKFKRNCMNYFDFSDVVGIGLLHSPKNSSLKCFASLNGQFLGSVDLSEKFIGMKLFPAACLYGKGHSIETNFGKKKWSYNPLELVQNEQ